MTDEDVRFGFDAYSLSDEAKAALDAFAEKVIAKNVGAYLEIQGHTDNIGSESDNLSLGYNILPGEVFLGEGRAYNTNLYLIAGVGATRFAGDDRFTVNVGAGYRFLLNDSVALHIDFRDHLYDIDLLGEEKTVHNLEGHLGFTVFF